MTRSRRLACVCLVALAWPASAQQRPVWDRPFTGDRSISNGFDLDRTDGTSRDFRGWTSGDDDGLHAPHPIDGHAGVDFPMPNDTPVLAVEDGTVTGVSDGVPWDDDAAANWVELTHAGGRSSTYWHLGPGVRALVVPTQVVTSGTVVGKSDNTGDSTGPHLHFGDFQDGVAGDPFQRGRFTDPSLAFTVRCAPSDGLALAVRRNPDDASEAVSTLSPGRCVVVTEERTGYARIHVMSGLKQLGARETDGCVSTSATVDEGWIPSATQWAGTAGFAHGSYFATAAPPSIHLSFDSEDPEPATYDVDVAFSGPVNAHARWTMTGVDGELSGTFEQVGRPKGTKLDPIDVPTVDFVDAATTVGGDTAHDRTNCPGGRPLAGPERWYRFSLKQAGRIDARVSSAAADVAQYVLGAADPQRCLIAGGGRVTTGSLAAGTYFLVVEVSEDGLGAPYSLTVSAPTLTPGLPYTSDRWLPLGRMHVASNPRLTFTFNGTKPFASRPFRAGIEAVRLRPVDGADHGFVRLDQLSDPLPAASIVAVTRRDSTPLRLFPEATVRPVAFAPLGSHFVAGARGEGFVAVDVPGWEGRLHAWAEDVTAFDGDDFARARTCPQDLEDLDGRSLDRDGDRIIDALDDCPDVADPRQVDLDRDRVGDACDACPLDPLDDRDHDGRCDSADACPLVPDDGVDTDADGLPDACDPCPSDPGNDANEDDVCDPPPPPKKPCGCAGPSDAVPGLAALLGLRRRSKARDAGRRPL